MRMVLLLSFLLTPLPGQTLELRSQIAGEVTASTAIIQARTVQAGTGTSANHGVASVGRLVVWSEDADEPIVSDWLSAKASNDFFLKHCVRGLSAGTRYSYFFTFGVDREHQHEGAEGVFRTLSPDSDVDVSFAVVTGMNFAHFHRGRQGKAKRAYQGDDKRLGYPALRSILELAPDYFIGTGDNVYYDRLAADTARDRPAMRLKWHQQFAQPRFVDLFACIPTYWEKDDHDYRLNDSDTTGDRRPSHVDGIATFREQVPVTDPADPQAVTYRTHRLTKHVQIWLLEGRDYRHPNRQAPGPGKSLWGAVQKQWLMETLEASDASFKIIVSPTPMVGPDDAYKRDNHVNPKGFRDEGEAFFAWLKKARPSAGSRSNVYLVCGDRHWQYHSVHTSGVEEFSCGALVDANARLGRRPGGPKSTDPEAKIRQPFTQKKAGGGFLIVRVAGGARPSLRFTLFDTQGTEWYSVIRTVGSQKR